MGDDTSATVEEMPLGHAPVAKSVKLHPMQRIAAAHLLKSQHNTAAVTVFCDVDADNLVDLHRDIRRCHGAVEEPNISVSHILIALLAEALKSHPMMNAMRRGDRLEMYDEINIGMAVALADGNLVVPVIRQVDCLDLGQIASKATDLRQRATAGRLSLDDVRGGTFTFTNAGMVAGISWTTPIVPFGQVAILGVGSMRRAPVVRDDRVVPGWLLPLSLTFDHAAFNGYPASVFLSNLAASVADPRTSNADLRCD